MSLAISGLGVISAIGLDVKENLASLCACRDGIVPLSIFESTLNLPVGQVSYTNDQLKDLLKIQDNKTYSRTALLGMLAASEALRDSALDTSLLRVGLISATSVGGMDLTENFYKDFIKDATKGRLRLVVGHDCYCSTHQIAEYCRIKDFTSTISTACSSAANAVGLGARLIEQDILDAVLVGGTDALCKFTINGFNSLMILDNNKCKPFSQERAGLNLGEGAAFLVLQKTKTLKKEPYCFLAAYANANDAYHQTASSQNGEGAFLAMTNAIKMSGLQKEDIAYINVHGTGTANNDASEGAAIRRIWLTNAPMFSSTKAYTGHTLAAAGGIEAVYSVLSLSKGLIFPSLNFVSPIKDLSLVPVCRLLENKDIKAVMSNSFGFGGNNASLIFAKENIIDNKMDKPEPKIYINAISSDKEALDYKELIPCANMRRRMSSILKKGVGVAMDCLKKADINIPDAIITASALGCLADSEKFLKSIIENNEQLLAPTPFIQSTFNTIGGQIAIITGAHGYNVTYSHRDYSFESALLDAITLLKDGIVENVLLGAADENTNTQLAICTRLGMYNKFNQAKDGVAFFMLSTKASKNPLAIIKSINIGNIKENEAELNSKYNAIVNVGKNFHTQIAQSLIIALGKLQVELLENIGIKNSDKSFIVLEKIK